MDLPNLVPIAGCITRWIFKRCSAGFRIQKLSNYLQDWLPYQGQRTVFLTYFLDWLPYYSQRPQSSKLIFLTGCLTKVKKLSLPNLFSRLVALSRPKISVCPTAFLDWLPFQGQRSHSAQLPFLTGCLTKVKYLSLPNFLFLTGCLTKVKDLSLPNCLSWLVAFSRSKISFCPIAFLDWLPYEGQRSQSAQLPFLTGCLTKVKDLILPNCLSWLVAFSRSKISFCPIAFLDWLPYEGQRSQSAQLPFLTGCLTKVKDLSLPNFLFLTGCLTKVKDLSLPNCLSWLVALRRSKISVYPTSFSWLVALRRPKTPVSPSTIYPEWEEKNSSFPQDN